MSFITVRAYLLTLQKASKNETNFKSHTNIRTSCSSCYLSFTLTKENYTLIQKL